MPFFIWSKSELGLDIEHMDNEHQILIESMNRLYDLNEAGAAKSSLDSALKQLLNLTIKHFKNEEFYMRSIEYPGYENHKVIHQKLLSRFQEHIDQFRLSFDKIDDDFFRFLQVWLTAHIMGIDRDYAKHAGAKSV